MTSRIGSPNTQADLEVRACLDRTPPQSFVMVAGAGSGKTTSLIKTLAYLADTRGHAMRRTGQQIACITYTEGAVKEILSDVGSSPLFHISTIHSFLWSVIRPFQSDIAAWVVSRIEEKIAERRAHHDKPGTRAATKQRLQQEMAELQGELGTISRFAKFTYGAGSSYAEGILGHDDILRLAPACIQAHRLLRQLVAARFPYIFVDESQDTNPQVVDALRQIADGQPNFCLGFFGDPMQKIYTSGAGAVPLGQDWAQITKPENFRCPTSVLQVVNAIRAQGDGLEQIGGRHATVGGERRAVVGTANVFVLPADAQRSERLTTVRRWLAAETGDALWTSDLREGDVRMLVLVHRMAAIRLGFPKLFAALTDRAPLSLSDGVSDGTAWPLRPFVQYILPMVAAAREGDHFAVMSMLRSQSPQLDPMHLRGKPVSPVLTALQQALVTLLELMADDTPATVRNVLLHAQRSELIRLDDRFSVHLAAEPTDDGSSDFANVQAFLNCGVDELWAYRRYFTEESPFATHHGVKGAQFERVLVVIDDEEARFFQFSYGKYFGYVPLSDTDQEKIDAGEDSVLERTRRLFYVCCSRALKDLAVVVFVPDVVAARSAIIGRQIFREHAIRGVEDLR